MSASVASVDDAPKAPLVAVAQLTATNDHAKNFQDAVKCAKDAAAQGCSFLALPECFSFIGSSVQETLEQAEALDGPRVKQYCELANEYKLFLSCGGFHERCPNEEKVFNTHLMIDPNGKIVSIYRKIHLFDVDISNGPVLMESRSTNAGAELVTLDTAQTQNSPLDLVFGLTTCYDMRFSEIFTLLRERGAQVILVPSAFTVPTGRAHWEILLRARAIETQSFIIAAAQVGQHNQKRQSWGQAIIIDPWGEVLAAAPSVDSTNDSSNHSPCIVTARLDLARMEEVRTKMPITKHRRTDLFKVELRS